MHERDILPKVTKISVVLPVYGEEATLRELYRRLYETVTQKLGFDYEFIFVDDGSRDNSWVVIQELYVKDQRVIGLKFSRNFGHHIAVTAGIDWATGDYTVLMDSDLQDQPEEIPRLIAKLLEGYEVVFGIRKKRQFGFIKTATSRIVLYFMNKITNRNLELDSNIFRVLDKKVVEQLKAFREGDRYILGLISYIGFRQIGIPVEHGKRYAGETKYNVRRLLTLGMNMLTSFSDLPLKTASYFGLLVAFLSFLGAVWLVFRKIVFDGTIVGWTSVMVALFFMGGVQLTFLGILGQYVGRIYNESRKRPLYILDTVLERRAE